MSTEGYIGFNDLLGTNRYFREFAENFYGSNGTLNSDGTVSLGQDINRAFKEINDELRSEGRWSVLPVQKNEDGDFPESLKSWNAYLVIFNKLVSDFAGESDELPETITFFGSQANRFAETVTKGGVIFDNEIDAGELGIGKPEDVKIGSNTLGTFHNNWRGFPFGDTDPSDIAFGLIYGVQSVQNLAGAGFLGKDYPRTWTVEVIKAGEIGTADFVWSKNYGKTIEGTLTTDEDFQYLEDNVWVRFSPNSDGTSHFSVSDKWKWQTVPTGQRRTYGEEEGVPGKSARGF